MDSLLSKLRRSPELMSMVKRVRGYIPISDNTRTGALHRSWGMIFSSHMRGDYLEFGVYQGRSFIEAYKQYQLFAKWMADEMKSSESWRRKVAQTYIDYQPKFYAYDTFEGMPDNNEGSVNFAKGTFLGNEDKVRAECLKNRFPESLFKLKKGLFSNLKQSDLPERAAIINIDCDLYSSAMDALNICKPLFQQGTILLADDYNTFAASNNAGERKAIKEFSEKTGIKFEPWFPYHYIGQAFITHI
ncbi:MAG: TylF/MycF/NovP-related O-methyltransferase [Elusimicrobiota bacterium]